MHRNYGLGLYEFACERGFFGSHGVVIADGQEGEFRLIQFLDERHVSEHGCVTGEVGDAAVVGEGKYEASGLARLDHLAVVRETGTMDGVRHSYSD